MKSMRNNKTMGEIFRTVMSIILVLSVLLVAGCKKKETVQTEPPQTDAPVTAPQLTDPELEILGVEEQGEFVLIHTAYCTLKYPFAFSDMVKVDSVPEEKSLLFVAVLGQENIPAFALRFGVTAAIPVGTLQLPVTGDTTTVGIDLLPIPDSLAEEHHSSFYAVQEIINDVIASLEENAQFTPAES